MSANILATSVGILPAESRSHSSNLSQWVKKGEQAADLLFLDSTANQVQAGDLPDLGDLAGDHAAQRRADQRISILDVA